MKKVLVLMSTYNGVAYLKDQLDSIRLQKDVHIELLVRDDGSKDNTITLLKRYQADYEDLIVEIIEGNNIGSTASFTELIKYAYHIFIDKYDYFSLADQDDYWLENKLNRAVSMLEELDDTGANTYCSDTKVVDASLKLIEGIRPRKVFLTKERALARNIATGCTMVFNKRALELYAVKCPEYIKIHDHALFLICTFLGTVIYDKESYILYRQHGHNQIGGSDSIFNRTKDRFKQKGNLNEHYLEKTAKSFLESFSDLLSPQDIELIKSMAEYRTSIAKRMKLLFNPAISKEEFEDNLFFKLKVLLGGV